MKTTRSGVAFMYTTANLWFLLFVWMKKKSEFYYSIAEVSPGATMRPYCADGVIIAGDFNAVVHAQLLRCCIGEVFPGRQVGRLAQDVCWTLKSTKGYLNKILRSYEKFFSFPDSP